MSHSHAESGGRWARWLIVVLVVGSVAAASVALGLIVVGPMIQRRMETPPPALAVSGTVALPPSQPAVSPADVEIKERIIRRPAPRPLPPRPDELNVNLGMDPAAANAAVGLTDVRSSSRRSKPSIKATVTDAAGDLAGAPVDSAAAPDQAARDRHRLARHPDDASPDDAGTRPDQTGGDADSQPRAPSVPKARTHRTSPLDALPVLDPDGPASSSVRQLPSAASTPGPDVKPSGKTYRVQVGRFSDEQNAAKLRDELAQSGLSPRVVKTQKGGTTVYRVQVGTYKQKENADRQIESLKSRSYDPYLAEDEP